MSKKKLELDIREKPAKKVKLCGESFQAGEVLNSSFYDQCCIQLSKKLLGKYLVRKVRISDSSNHYLMAGKIVEVEAYLGGHLDPASHSYQNKKTERNQAMFMKPGTAYVYNIYGQYCCLNVSSKESGAGVLIRALEPVFGLDNMRSNRLNVKNDKHLTNGPGKLCKALSITKDMFDKVDLAEKNGLLWIQENNEGLENIVKSKRIGLNVKMVGQDAFDKLLRFHLKDNQFVSVKPKQQFDTDSEE
jgi:DNA-3-methyladenine glycosylase